MKKKTSNYKPTIVLKVDKETRFEIIRRARKAGVTVTEFVLAAVADYHPEGRPLTLEDMGVQP